MYQYPSLGIQKKYCTVLNSKHFPKPNARNRSLRCLRLVRARSPNDLSWRADRNTINQLENIKGYQHRLSLSSKQVSSNGNCSFLHQILLMRNRHNTTLAVPKIPINYHRTSYCYLLPNRALKTSCSSEVAASIKSVASSARGAKLMNKWLRKRSNNCRRNVT